jgi:hypothetical protein
MQTIEFPRYTASQPSYCMPPVANAISRGADNPIESGFLVTLLAMAGHDLRQPLQVIMSAHDVLETMLRDKKQQEELARAGDATGQLARMLSQLIDALQLQEPPREDLRALRYCSGPSWTTWWRSSVTPRASRGSPFE